MLKFAWKLCDKINVKTSMDVCVLQVYLETRHMNIT